MQKKKMLTFHSHVRVTLSYSVNLKALKEELRVRMSAGEIQAKSVGGKSFIRCGLWRNLITTPYGCSKSSKAGGTHGNLLHTPLAPYATKEKMFGTLCQKGKYDK
jgi:hypothetical protein